MDDEILPDLEITNHGEMSLRYKTLYNLYKKQQTELDRKEQKVYDLQRELARVSALEKDYLLEIEQLQADEQMKNTTLYKRIKDLEEEIVKLKNEHRETLHELEQEICEKNDQISVLREAIKKKERVLEHESNEKERFDKLMTENRTMQHQLFEMEECCKELKQLKEEADEHLVTLNTELKNLREMYISLKEKYESKRIELEEANDQIKLKQEEIFTMRNEMDFAKTPQEIESRGNSLFAEVNDRRIQLQTNMNAMQTKYMEMKKAHVSHLSKIKLLQMENETLSRMWKENVEQWKADVRNEKDAYEGRVNAFHDLFKQQAKMFDYMKLKHIIEQPSVNKYLEDMITTRDDIIKKLTSDINKLTLTQISYTKCLSLAHVKINDLRLKELNSEQKLAELLEKSSQETKDNNKNVDFAAPKKIINTKTKPILKASNNLMINKKEETNENNTAQLQNSKKSAFDENVDTVPCRDNESGKEPETAVIEKADGIKFSDDTKDAMEEKPEKMSRTRRRGRILTGPKLVL